MSDIPYPRHHIQPHQGPELRTQILCNRSVDLIVKFRYITLGIE